jgi:integrase
MRPGDTPHSTLARAAAQACGATPSTARRVEGGQLNPVDSSPLPGLGPVIGSTPGMGGLAAAAAFRPFPPHSPAAAEFVKAKNTVLNRLPHGPEYLRDRALVLTLFTTGLTPIEVAALTVDDYLHAAGNVRSVSELRAEIANNRRARTLLFVHEELVSALDAYLAQRPKHPATSPLLRQFRGLARDARLILGDRGRTLTFHDESRDGIRRGSRAFVDLCHRVFTGGRKRAGIRPNDARRLLGKALCEEGADLRELQHFLGFASRQKLMLLLESSGTCDVRLTTLLRKLR